MAQEIPELGEHQAPVLVDVTVGVAAKLDAAEFVGKIGPEISLPVIGAILATGVLASLWRERQSSKAPTGIEPV